MKLNKFNKNRNAMNGSRLNNRFVFFSIILFSFILVVGSAAFVFSMRYIVRSNKGIEMSQILETAQIRLESTVNAEISMVLKMAESPAIKRYFANPENMGFNEYAMEEINSFRRFFSDGYAIFWINDKDRIFYMDDAEAYWLDAEKPENYWYNMTLYETEDYNFNVNYNPDIQAINLWINAPVIGNDRKPIGMLGIGIELSSFIERAYHGIDDRLELYFSNADGEITGSTDIGLVNNKVNIMDVLSDISIDIITEAKKLYPGEMRTFYTPRGGVAIGTVPLLEWYTFAFMADSINDYRTPMTVLFIVVLVVISLIFIIFNVFIAQFLKSLHDAMESLEIASKAKSTFLANMSHEIRTPMNAILGTAEIIMQNESLSNEMEEGLGKIHNSCDMLLGIINDILDFTKIEAGKLDIIPAQYEIASLINDSVQLNMMRVGSKPLEIDIQVSENIPSKLIGDELRIKQILNNLLSNAIKYTDYGKITLSVAFEPFAESEHVMLVFEVIDTGHGMTKNQLEKVFEEYSRFNNKSIQGTGLGLAITQRLIRLMEGEINVESELGAGSRFTVRLPQRIVNSDVLSKEVVLNLQQFRMTNIAHKEKLKVVRDPMPYGSVLIVDDMETNLYVAVGLMNPYKLKIDTASSGLEAINKIKNGKVYDVIFMDHMMPEMDGMAATKHLRDSGYSNPIVALTANAVIGQSDMFLQNGFDDFISKPIDIRQLNSVLNKLIRDKQSNEVIEPEHIEFGNELNDGYAILSQSSPRLLESFTRDARKVVAILKELCQEMEWINHEENLRTFIIAIHGIGSSLLNIGEKNLAESAIELEEAGRERNFSFIAASAPLFLKTLGSFLEGLNIKHETEVNGMNENTPDIRAKLLLIKDMCADYDRKGALDSIAEINNCSGELQKVLEKINEYVRHSDFEEAEKTVSAYLTEFSHEETEPSKYIQTRARLLKKGIEGLDIAQGLERYDGDEETYLMILRSYASSVHSMLGAFNTVNNDNLARYKINIHGIKGASYDIFANQVGKKAEDLEKAAIVGDLSYINDHNPLFILDTDKFIGDIKDMLSAINAENPKPKKDKPGDDSLLKLLSACKDYNMRSVETAMAEIDKYQYDSDEGLVKWLKDNVDMAKYLQIANKLSDYFKTNA